MVKFSPYRIFVSIDFSFLLTINDLMVTAGMILLTTVVLICYIMIYVIGGSRTKIQIIIIIIIIVIHSLIYLTI